MSYEEFQALYEQESERHFQELMRCSEIELLDRIARKNRDGNYQIKHTSFLWITKHSLPISKKSCSAS